MASRDRFLKSLCNPTTKKRPKSSTDVMDFKLGLDHRLFWKWTVAKMSFVESQSGSGEAAVQEPTPKKPLEDQTSLQASPESTPRRLTLESDQTTDYESACEGEDNPSNLSLLAEELKSVHISTPKTLAPLTKFPYSPPEKDLFINETFGPESFLDENNEKTENPFVKEKTVDPLSLVCDLNETSLCLDITLDQTIVAPEKTQIFDKSIKENLSPNLNHSLKKVNSKNLDGSILEEFYDSENFFGAEDELNSQKQSNLPSSTTKLNLSAKSEFSDVSYDDPNDSILKRPETSFSEKSVIKESPTKSVNQSENINISENSIEEPAEAEVKEKSNCIEPQLESAEEPLQLDAPKTEIENFKTDEKPPQEVNEAAETRTLDISESFEKKQEPFTFETLEAGDSSPAKAPQESSAPELCQKKEDGSDQKPVADEKPDVETAKITEEKFDQTVDEKNSEKLEETGETVGSLEDINGEIVEIAKEVLSDKLETTDVQPESKNEEIAVKINESGVENQEDKLLNENNKESQKVSVFEENSSDKTETNSFQEVIESLNNSNEETGEKIVQSVETPVNRASVENEFNKTAESGNLEEPRKSINQEDKEEVAVGSPESQKAVENEINKTVETEDLKPKKSIKQEEKAETEDFPASQKVGTPVENGISQIVASEDLKVPRKSITQENKKEVTEVLPASQKVATLVENGIDQTVACEDLKDSKKSIIQEDNKEETEVLPASQKVATPVENGISQIVASEDLQEPRKSIKQEEKAALTDDFSESHKVATPVENGINQTVDLKDPKKFINQEDKKEVTEVLPEVPSSVESNKIVNSEDLKEPRKSINDSVEAIESSERSIETTAFESECNETSIFKEPNKPAKRSNDSSTKSEELSIALGGSDFSNVFCDTISETFSPQACDLSSLQLKLDEKLTLSQALTDETILELKKDYTEEYFSITDAVNERAKLNGHPNNRILTVINEESFLISSSDTELFKSDSTSLASSIREDSLEPDLNPSREDSLEPSSLFGRTLNSMEKSYNSLQEIYETCSKQERELGCTDVVEPVLFNLSISAEAKRLADDFSKMDLTSETLKDVRPPQHMMHSVNSSEAGPVTADEDFKKTDKFCNATDFDFEAIDKLEKGDQNKTALPRNSIFLKFDPLFQHIQKEANQSMMSDHGDPEKTVIENKTPQKEQLRVNAVTPINREKRASLSPNAGTKTPGSDFLSKEIAKLQELMLQQEAAHQHVALESEEKSERIDQLKKRIAELESRDPNVGLEGKLKQLEAENAKLKKELSVTKTENKQLVNVMEEYEKTISQLMASKDEMQNQYEKDKEKIAMERDDAVSHLNNLEVAFSDVHLKYEKSKTIIEQLHNNEKLMNESLQEHVKVIAKKNANYEKLKLHATEKLAAANQEIANLTNSHKMEITKLNASNKRAEITIKSLEEALEQKKSEVLELTKICDELIGTDTSKN